MSTTTNEPPTIVLLLCGLPGAGKSRLVASLPSTAIPIEYDQVQDDLLLDNSLEAWRTSRHVALEQLSQHLSSSSQLIVLDDNFYWRSMRKQVYQTCQQYLIQQQHPSPIIYLGIVWLDTPLDTCLQRNRQPGTQ